MNKIEAYQTMDGKLFPTLEEAKEHSNQEYMDNLHYLSARAVATVKDIATVEDMHAAFMELFAKDLSIFNNMYKWRMDSEMEEGEPIGYGDVESTDEGER